MNIIRHFLFNKLFLLFILSYSVPNHAKGPPTPVYHGYRQEKKVALTFDACPTKTYPSLDLKVLKILKKYKIPTTLFLSGKWIKNNKDSLKLLSNWPFFEFGNHSFRHPHMTKLDSLEVEKEILKSQRIFIEYLGRAPILFRAPYGEIDQNLSSLIYNLGLIPIQFDLASGDPDRKLSPQKLSKNVLNNIRNGSIIVFHINKNGHSTGKALEGIITTLKKRGFHLTTVSALLKKKNAVLDVTNLFSHTGEKHP